MLVDTNPLLRASQPDHPMYAQAVDAIEALLLRGENLRIAPQNLIEFWAVATRPAGAPNGLGLTPEQVAQEIARLKQQFPLILDTADVYPEWERLVTTYGVRGRQVYDARLAAVMLVNGITHKNVSGNCLLQVTEE